MLHRLQFKVFVSILLFDHRVATKTNKSHNFHSSLKGQLYWGVGVYLKLGLRVQNLQF